MSKQDRRQDWLKPKSYMKPWLKVELPGLWLSIRPVLRKKLLQFDQLDYTLSIGLQNMTRPMLTGEGAMKLSNSYEVTIGPKTWTSSFLVEHFSVILQLVDLLNIPAPLLEIS